MEKKGISPLIATVLLIGITIMISLIVFNFVRSTIEGKINETEVQGNILMTCSQTLNLEYSDPAPCGSNAVLNVTVWNKSPLDVQDLKIQVLSSDESILKEGGVLVSYNKTIYEIEGIVISEINKIILTPTIDLDGTSGACPSISFEVKDLGICDV